MEENQKQEQNSNLDVNSLKSILDDLNKTKPKKKGLFSKLFSKNEDNDSLSKDKKLDDLNNLDKPNQLDDLKHNDNVISSNKYDENNFVFNNDVSQSRNQENEKDNNLNESKLNKVEDEKSYNEEKDNIDEELLELKSRISKIRNMIDDSVSELKDDDSKNQKEVINHDEETPLKNINMNENVDENRINILNSNMNAKDNST